MKLKDLKLLHYTGLYCGGLALKCHPEDSCTEGLIQRVVLLRCDWILRSLTSPGDEMNV